MKKEVSSLTRVVVSPSSSICEITSLIVIIDDDELKAHRSHQYRPYFWDNINSYREDHGSHRRRYSSDESDLSPEESDLSLDKRITYFSNGR